ncbi:MAG TPA: alpha/beta hydrolase [Burkholderiales bacterium]|jgi:pimeloyl-ACP methyl ester carboxylesterase|nr:alpha/beta hydrolase [Burkholderiales bacterium]
MTLPAPHFREAGAGPAVILIHAGAASSSQWRPLVARLAGKFRVLACDLSGCGKSPAFPPGLRYTLDEEVTFLAPVFEAAGEGFHLVGHSYGGAVALKAALRHRARLRSLTLYEPVLFSLLVARAPESEAAREILDLARRTTHLAQHEDLEGAAREFVDYWFQTRMWASMREEVRAAIRAGMDRSGRRWDALLKDPIELAELAAIDMPALFLVGQISTAPTRVLSELLIRALPNARAVNIRGVGHMAPLANPEQVNPLIESFLLAQRG